MTAIDEEYERLLFEQLRIIQEAHDKAAKPIIDRIVELRSRQLRPIFVSIEHLNAEQRERVVGVDKRLGEGR